MKADVLPFPEAEPDLVLVDAGSYDAAYVNHTTGGAFGGRLTVNFKIVSMGPFFGQVVPAFYRVRETNRKRSAFSVARHSRFAREWRLLFRRAPNRWDRIPMSALKDFVVRIRVRTVTIDFEQRPLDPVNQYSTAEIIGRAE